MERIEGNRNKTRKRQRVAVFPPKTIIKQGGMGVVWAWSTFR